MNTTTTNTRPTDAELVQASIYAFPYRVRHGENTPLDLVNWPAFTLSRSEGYQRERQRGREGFTPAWLGPFTLTDGRYVKVRPAKCGAGCFCAAEYKVVK